MSKIKCTTLSFFLLTLSVNVFKNLTPNHRKEKKNLSGYWRNSQGSAIYFVLGIENFWWNDRGALVFFYHLQGASMKKNYKSGFASLTIIMFRAGYKTHPVVSIDSAIPHIHTAFRTFFLKISFCQDVGEIVFAPIVKYKQYTHQQSGQDYHIDKNNGKYCFHDR